MGKTLNDKNWSKIEIVEIWLSMTKTTVKIQVKIFLWIFHFLTFSSESEWWVCWEKGLIDQNWSKIDGVTDNNQKKNLSATVTYLSIFNIPIAIGMVSSFEKSFEWSKLVENWWSEEQETKKEFEYHCKPKIFYSKHHHQNPNGQFAAQAIHFLCMLWRDGSFHLYLFAVNSANILAFSFACCWLHISMTPVPNQFIRDCWSMCPMHCMDN